MCFKLLVSSPLSAFYKSIPAPRLAHVPSVHAEKDQFHIVLPLFDWRISPITPLSHQRLPSSGAVGPVREQFTCLREVLRETLLERAQPAGKLRSLFVEGYRGAN